MAVKMGQLEVQKVFISSETANAEGEFEFIIDCEGVYFDALYNNDGQLQFIDQYFYTPSRSHDDMERESMLKALLQVESDDFPVKAYLLAKEEAGKEWIRFHAIVPQAVNGDYFFQKYIGE